MQLILKSIHFTIICMFTIAGFLHAAQLNQDIMLITFKDLDYHTIKNFSCTNTYYNETINAFFYAKMLDGKMCTLLRSQLLQDEIFGRIFYDIQTRKHATLVKKNAELVKSNQDPRTINLNEKSIKDFGLVELFAVQDLHINLLIDRYLHTQYTDYFFEIGNSENQLLSFKKYRSKKITFENKVLFFSNTKEFTQYKNPIEVLNLLMAQIKAKNVPAVKKLLQEHDPSDFVNKHSLHKLLKPLCELADYDIIKTFIEEKIHLNKYIKENMYCFALNFLYSTDSLALFIQLLENTSESIDCTEIIAKILYKCTQRGKVKWIERILQSSKMNKKILQIKFAHEKVKISSYGKALFNIMSKSTCKIVILLLPYGPAHASEIALAIACESGDQELVDYLLNEQNADVGYSYNDGKPMPIVQWAIEQETKENIILSLVEKAPLSLINQLLCSALEYGLEKVCNLLINKGADVNNLNDQGICPFSYAFTYQKNKNYQQMVDLLVHHKANIHYKNKNGNTALHDACSSHAYLISLIQYLVIDHKLDINVQNEEGKTPLHLIAGKNDYKITKFLLENGADADRKDNKQRSPLRDCKIRSYAWEYRKAMWDNDSRVNTIQLLLKYGASILCAMQSTYDQLACICLLEEDEYLVDLLKRLFTPLRPSLTNDDIVILTNLARRNNNTAMIKILKENRFITLCKVLVSDPAESQAKAPSLQNQPEKNLLLKQYFYLCAPYIIVPVIGMLLFYTAKRSYGSF